MNEDAFWAANLSTTGTVKLIGPAAGGTPPPLSTDATLSGLTVYDGNSNLTLSPAFASGAETYTASAASDIAAVTVTATKNRRRTRRSPGWTRPTPTLDDADTGAAGFQVALGAGANTSSRSR